MLFVVRCSLFVECWLLYVVASCSSLLVCGLLFDMVCSLLFAVVGGVLLVVR